MKARVIEADGRHFERFPIKTKLVMYGDRVEDVVREFAADSLREGDILFISEKIVAITQGRAYPIKEVKPRKLATFLSKYVHKTPHGIGLGMPETMEMALRECGTLRILFAAFFSALTKLFGIRGVFYSIAGYKAASIDGPTHNTIPPYNEYVVLGPEKPNEVAKSVSKAFSGVKVAVVDINDLAGVILGVSHSDMDKSLLVKILKDNPLGQDDQSTPLGIIREVK